MTNFSERPRVAWHPDVTIVIPTKNAGEEFNQLLEQIDTQDYKGNIEVVVIDSRSTNDTVSVAREHGASVYEISPEEFHHSQTRNKGAKHATGDVIVFTVQDAIPIDDNWLSILVARLKNPSVGVVYGRQIAYPDAKPMEKFFYDYFYPDKKRQVAPGDISNESEFYLSNIYVSDVAAAVRANVFKQHKFAANVPMAEDKEFALRLLNSDYTVEYEPRATMYHSHEYSISSLLRRRFKDGRAYGNITSDGEASFASEGWSYLLAEFHFLKQEGYVHWIPYAVLYDFIYFLGFQLGRIYAKVE